MDSREAWQLDSEDLKSEVLDLVRARHELQSRMVLLIVEMFSRDVLGGKGFRAIAQWLHGSTNLEIGECSLLVGLARLLMLEPVVGDAFHRGDVDALKARQVASFCQHPPKNMTPADVDKARGFCLAWRRRTLPIVMRCGRRSAGSRSSTANARTAFRSVRIRSVTSSTRRKVCTGACR